MIQPSSPRRSSACATRPSFSYTSCRSKPKASVRNAIAAWASGYLSAGKMVAMARTLRRAAGLVLDGWERRRVHAATLGHDPRAVLGRRAAGQLAEVAVEVRLVVVAGLGGDLGEARGPAGALEQREHAAEAQDARERLGRQAHLLAEAAREMPPAAAELGAQRAHTERAVGRPQPRERVRDVGPSGLGV